MYQDKQDIIYERNNKNPKISGAEKRHNIIYIKNIYITII